MSPVEFVWRSVVLALALLVLVRLVGKRLVGEVAAVDLVVGITVGTIAGSTAISDRVPLWGGLLALLVWGVFEYLSAYLSSRSPLIEFLVSGKATQVVQGGSVRRRALSRAMVSENALRSMLRQRQIAEPSDVREAWLEPSGKLGVMPQPRPDGS